MNKEKKEASMKTFIKIVSAPILGLIFFLALPVISVCLIGYTLCEKIYLGLRIVLSKMLYFAWTPCEAYLSGKKRSVRNTKKQ
jgi:predicted permease